MEHENTSPAETLNSQSDAVLTALADFAALTVRIEAAVGEISIAQTKAVNAVQAAGAKMLSAIESAQRSPRHGADNPDFMQPRYTDVD
jgi:hypothetical protein